MCYSNTYTIHAFCPKQGAIQGISAVTCHELSAVVSSVDVCTRCSWNPSASVPRTSSTRLGKDPLPLHCPVYFILRLYFPGFNIPVNMPDPIHTRSGSAGKHWPEAGRMIVAHWLTSGPDPFGQNLTQSARIKSDPGWFCTILPGTSVEERNRVWKWETGSGPVASCQKPGPLIPALACFRMRWI